MKEIDLDSLITNLVEGTNIQRFQAACSLIEQNHLSRKTISIIKKLLYHENKTISCLAWVVLGKRGPNNSNLIKALVTALSCEDDSHDWVFGQNRAGMSARFGNMGPAAEAAISEALASPQNNISEKACRFLHEFIKQRSLRSILEFNDIKATYLQSNNITYESGPDPAFLARHPRSEDGYLIGLIFYSTNRSAADPPLYFSAERNYLSYGVIPVTIPRNRRMGEIEKSKIWDLGFGIGGIHKDPNKDIAIVPEIEYLEEEIFHRCLSHYSSDSNNKALIFIPGYNNTFEDGIRRLAQLAYDLDYIGVPILYSWPSGGKILHYVCR